MKKTIRKIKMRTRLKSWSIEMRRRSSLMKRQKRLWGT
jgi:hypothetical protein